MRLEYVDMRHELTTDDERDGQYDAWVQVKVRGASRPDAAALADCIEQAVERFVGHAVAR